MMKSLFTANSLTTDIDEFFSVSNNALKNSRLDKMMMAFGMINIHENRIVISNAGIPPIYIYRKGKKIAEEVKLNGLPLGAMKNTNYEIYQSDLSKGDTILMLSDGFPELQNDNSDIYGYERVKSSFEYVADKASNEIISNLKNEGLSWTNGKAPDDDITFVVLKLK